MRTFSFSEGNAAMRTRGEVGKSYVFIAFGIILHFIWEVLVTALKTNVPPEFGAWWAIAARIVVAFIVTAMSFVGIWKQLEGADPKVRFFIAVSQGFAIDALASPVAAQSSSS